MPDLTEPESPQGASDDVTAATPSEEEAVPTTESSNPMLDVHASHQPIHTWKDFLVHIAAIAIGLLLALGLEQAVEWMHSRHQLQQARKELSLELEQNKQILQKNLEQVGKIQAELDRDMRVLHEHEASRTPTSAKLDYSWIFYRTPDAAWEAVKQNGSLSLMPYDELKANTYIYEVFAAIMESADAFNTAIETAGAIARRSPDGNLSHSDTEELITATSEAQGKLAFTARLLRFEQNGLEQSGREFARSTSTAR